jgi:hypothetical protein
MGFLSDLCPGSVTEKLGASCVSPLQLVSTCIRCITSILHSAGADRAIMLKAHLPDIFLLKMASQGRGLIGWILIGSLIDWWSRVIYWLVSLPNELRERGEPKGKQTTFSFKLWLYIMTQHWFILGTAAVFIRMWCGVVFGVHFQLKYTRSVIDWNHGKQNTWLKDVFPSPEQNTSPIYWF